MWLHTVLTFDNRTFYIVFTTKCFIVCKYNGKVTVLEVHIFRLRLYSVFLYRIPPCYDI